MMVLPPTRVDQDVDSSELVDGFLHRASTDWGSSASACLAYARSPRGLDRRQPPLEPLARVGVHGHDDAALGADDVGGGPAEPAPAAVISATFPPKTHWRSSSGRGRRAAPSRRRCHGRIRLERAPEGELLAHLADRGEHSWPSRRMQLFASSLLTKPSLVQKPR